MNANKETALGCAMWGGVALIPVGVVMFMASSFAGLGQFGLSGGRDVGGIVAAPLALIITVAGILISGTSLMYGIYIGKKEYKPSGSITSLPDCRIMAKYVYDDRGQQMHEEWQWEVAEVKRFYIKLEFPNGAVQEFQCEEELYKQCGEGTRGQAFVDGKWLGGFQVHIGAGGAPDRGAISSGNVDKAYDQTQFLK